MNLTKIADAKKHNVPRWLPGLLLVSVLLAGGALVRILPRPSSAISSPAWQVWKSPPIVNLYFSEGRHLFPVSRRLTANRDVARAALEALLAGPPANSGLTNPLPKSAVIRSLEIADGIARVDVSREFLAAGVIGEAAQVAIVETLTALPGIATVSFSVEGKPVGEAQREPLLFYASATGLAAQTEHASPTRAVPRTVLGAYLAGPMDADLTGLPSDVRLLHYDQARDGVLSLQFSYTPSVRNLAIDHPEKMRTVLLGLIASLTEFPEVRAVRLGFEGRSRLGLGQCSDLLNTPQPKPVLLNDERLLGR